MWLVGTQALHWLAFPGRDVLMFLPEVRGVVNDNATSLALLILLALGTFVAGVHARAWRICLVGIVLAVAFAGRGLDPGFRHAAAGRRADDRVGRRPVLVAAAARDAPSMTARLP